MSSGTKKRKVKSSGFPRFLKPTHDNRTALIWIGKRLKEIRGEKAPEAVARSVSVTPPKIRALEKGSFRLALGELRRIVRDGYGADFGDLLLECFDQNSSIFNPTRESPFERDFYYALSLRPNIKQKAGPTPLLIGGDPRSFLWAIPMRRLKNQPNVTELWEIAPQRKNPLKGLTSLNSHDGSEVVFVIHGRITAYVRTNEKDVGRPLQYEDCIHFNSTRQHYLENTEKSLSALLLVVRFQPSNLRPV